MASAGRDTLTECGEIIKCTRTYNARADGCGAGARRVVTTGRAPRNDGSAPCDDEYLARDDGSTMPDDGSTARDDGSTARDDGSAMRDDGYGSLKKNRRRWVRNARRRVKGRATTGVAQATTAEIARRWLRSRDDGSQVGRRRVRPRADESRPQYIRGAG